MEAGQETLLAEVLSPSQVSQFLNCPAKWMFRYAECCRSVWRDLAPSTPTGAGTQAPDSGSRDHRDSSNQGCSLSPSCV